VTFRIEYDRPSARFVFGSLWKFNPRYYANRCAPTFPLYDDDSLKFHAGVGFRLAKDNLL
jgi:hypothetical protein